MSVTTLPLAPAMIGLVEKARYDASFGEGLLAAYRQLDRPHLAFGLIDAMAGLDAFEPDQAPSMNRCTVLPSIRRTPDGTLIDLTRPFTDRLGETWFTVGYTLTGRPLVTIAPDLGYYADIAEIWDAAGPFTQASPSADEWTEAAR
ncbi:MAG TPA: hypothetical protein VGX23_33585 [Actinocrinis sp.]|nr:hypothetical protein [Actinocrinis sp.]